jgi:hypothetical protein
LPSAGAIKTLIPRPESRGKNLRRSGSRGVRLGQCSGMST